jgi:hypothetical protein
MEATFVVQPGELTGQLMARIEALFADSENPVTIHVAEVESAPFDFQQWFLGMEAIRARTELVAVPAGLGDLNDLIDSINDADLDQ